MSYIIGLSIFYYNAVNVYCRELAPGTVSLTGDRAQGNDSKHWANSKRNHDICKHDLSKLSKQHIRNDRLINMTFKK